MMWNTQKLITNWIDNEVKEETQNESDVTTQSDRVEFDAIN